MPDILFSPDYIVWFSDLKQRISLARQQAKNPQAGDLMPAGGGIRKLRFALPGKGKRGGARLIYYWQTSKDKIYLLLAYAKAKQENLEPAQITILKALVKELERHGRRAF